MKNKKADKVEKIGMVVFFSLWAIQMIITIIVTKGGF